MPITGTPCGSCDALRTDLSESDARRNELWKQTLEMVEQAKRPGTPEEVAALRRLASIAQDAATQFSDWIGSASTRNATTDSMYRLARALDAAGYPYNSHRCLDWRGSVLHELNDAGFFFSEEKEAFVFDPDAEKARPYRNHGNAVGPTLKEIAAQLRAAEGERDQQQKYITEHKAFIQRLLEAAGVCDPESENDAVEAVKSLLTQVAAAEEAKERAERALKEALASPGNLFVCRKCNVLVPRAEMEQHEHDREALRARATAAEGALREAREENGRIRKAYSALRDSYQGVLDFARDVHAIVSGKVQRTGMVRASPAVVARLIASDAVPTLDDALAADRRAQPPPPETPCPT